MPTCRRGSCWTRAAAALASLVKTDGRSLVVLNPTSWPRTDIVRVSCPKASTVAEPGVVACDGHHGTYMLVKDVPACGYRVLKLAASGERVQPQSRRRNDDRKHVLPRGVRPGDRRGDQHPATRNSAANWSIRRPPTD